MGGFNMYKHIIIAFAALIIALALLQPARADSSQPQPTPTPTTANGGGPSDPVPNKVFLPFISIDGGVGGQGRYWGGRQAVSWCPGCNPAAS